MDDVFVGFGITGLVVDVPAEGFEEGVEVFAAELGFVVLAGFVSFDMEIETLDEIDNFFRRAHRVKVNGLKEKMAGIQGESSRENSEDTGMARNTPKGPRCF